LRRGRSRPRSVRHRADGERPGLHYPSPVATAGTSDVTWDSHAGNDGGDRPSDPPEQARGLLGDVVAQLRRQTELLRRDRLLEARGNAIAAVVTYGEVIRAGKGGAAELARQRVSDIVRRAS